MTEDPRWTHLINASFHLDQTPRPSPRAALTALHSVLELFDGGVDPLGDYRAYAVRRLALSLRRALEGEEAPPGG